MLLCYNIAMNPHFAEQAEIIRKQRRSDFDVLRESGILKKLLAHARTEVLADFGESVPVVLGSRTEGSLSLFLGLELKTRTEHRTKVHLVGVLTETCQPNRTLGFSDEDCETVRGLFENLEIVATQNAPSYNPETGVFSYE